jgi:hypothetical protein
MKDYIELNVCITLHVRPLGRHRRRCEDNIKNIQEVGGGRGDWREVAKDRKGRRALVSTVNNLRVP